MLIQTYCCNHLIPDPPITVWVAAKRHEVTNTVPLCIHTEGHIRFRPRLIAYLS